MIFCTIIAILIVSGVFAIAGLVYWGLGSLICVAFSINFNWTYLCGLATAFIVYILEEIFGKKEK